MDGGKRAIYCADLIWSLLVDDSFSLCLILPPAMGDVRSRRSVHGLRHSLLCVCVCVLCAHAAAGKEEGWSGGISTAAL